MVGVGDGRRLGGDLLAGFRLGEAWALGLGALRLL